MTRSLTVRLSGVLIACLLSVFSYSQNVTGIWRGYFIADDGSQYKLEFQVRQQASGELVTTGVSYSWKMDKRFYGKATMTGNFMAESKNFRIREIKTVEVKSDGMGGTCIMNYNLAWSKSGKEEFLEGTYLGKQEGSGNSALYEWGDCGGGKVFLRRVTKSDFYEEPFLRKPAVSAKTTPKTTPKPTPKPTPKTETATATPPPARSTTTTAKTATGKTSGTPPKTNKPNTAKTSPPPATAKSTTPKASAKVTTPVRAGADTTITRPVIAKTTPRSLPAPPPVLRTRQRDLMSSLVVNDPVVSIKLYDNGEIDDDSISVYFDNRLLKSNQRLTTAAISLQVTLEDDGQDHELVMVAENLGRIPPNTSLMVVEAGDQRFTVRITSTEQKNAVVRFRYQRP